MMRKLVLSLALILTACVPVNSGTASTLKTVEQEIVGQPESDPLHFTTVAGKNYSAEDLAGTGQEPFADNTISESPGGLWVEINGKKLIATENYNSDCTQGIVTLTRNGQEIYHIDTGSCSPMPALQGLWTYDGHWVLETNHYADATPFNGKISQDGVVLNDQEGYAEAFGFQTIHDRPFYFFKKDGRIDAWYDGQTISLGYDSIPHYACCGDSVLNPHKFKNMTAFFATRGEKWYYVQIGALDQP